MRETRQRRFKRKFGKRILEQLHKAQKNEITEYAIYKELATYTKETGNRRILRKIAEEEKKHSQFWGLYTNKSEVPNKSKVFFHTLIAKILGLTFAVKMMENGEMLAQINYQEIAKEIPDAQSIKEDEDKHEHQLLNLLDEEKLRYVGSMVLGVNDALVELTGALAGLTLALQKSDLIALTGLIIGIAASLSMGASEYLSVKSEGKSNKKDPIKAAIYTGVMYLITVTILIVPYFIFSNIYLSLTVTLFNAVTIILFFTIYISVAQDLPFKKRFLEMAGISLGVSAFTFIIGYLVRIVFGIEV